MAVERRDPVPPGRYYAFVDEDKAEHWSDWVAEYKDRVRVVAMEAQTLTPNVPVWATTPTGEIIKAYAGDWVLFDVLSPVPWVNIGLPTIVTDMRVKSTRDVYQLPPPGSDEGPLDQMAQSVQLLITLATVGGVLLLGNAVLQGFKITRTNGAQS